MFNITRAFLKKRRERNKRKIEMLEGMCFLDGKEGEALERLSEVKKNKICKIAVAKCDPHLSHRLLEMGFIPGEDVEVLTNSGKKGSVMVRIKGSKVALSNKIACNILVEENGKRK